MSHQATGLITRVVGSCLKAAASGCRLSRPWVMPRCQRVAPCGLQAPGGEAQAGSHLSHTACILCCAFSWASASVCCVQCLSSINIHPSAPCKRPLGRGQPLKDTCAYVERPGMKPTASGNCAALTAPSSLTRKTEKAPCGAPMSPQGPHVLLLGGQCLTQLANTTTMFCQPQSSRQLLLLGLQDFKIRLVRIRDSAWKFALLTEPSFAVEGNASGLAAMERALWQGSKPASSQHQPYLMVYSTGKASVLILASSQK